jgi:hypothetical protein
MTTASWGSQLRTPGEGDSSNRRMVGEPSGEAAFGDAGGKEDEVDRIDHAGGWGGKSESLAPGIEAERHVVGAELGPAVRVPEGDAAGGEEGEGGDDMIGAAGEGRIVGEQMTAEVDGGGFGG